MTSYTLTSPKLWRLLEGWPFREHVDAYIALMLAQHFSTRHTYHAVRAIGEFARWLTEDHGDSCDIDERTVSSFLAWRRQQTGYRHGSPTALVRFLGVLRAVGAISLGLPSADPRDLLLSAYQPFLEHGRGFMPKSSASYVWFARPFVQECWVKGKGLSSLSRADVIAYVERHAPRRGAATAKIMCCRLRSFLRYLKAEGIADDDLAASVPSIKGWTLTSLPTFLTPEQLDRVLAHCDRTTVAGRRDYAVLLLLARLGLRANEVATLKLDDIDWAAGVFEITGKGGRRATMPMPLDVGAAIADYLRHARPVCEHREVFLRVETPCVPFASYAPVSLLARRALIRAGVTGIAKRHAHVFRHTLATDMVRAGATLAEIGHVLRHQVDDATRVYAKVDLPRLRLLSQPWPGDAQ